MKKTLILLVLFIGTSAFSTDRLLAQGWFSQTSGVSNTLEGVSFTSKDTGMTVGGSGAMLRTTNGGTTWTTQSSGTTQTLHWVSFRNASVGSVVGDNGVIRRTTDGGTIWTPQTSGTSSTLYEILYVTANTGFAVGSNGKILRTTNAGTTWSSQSSGTSQTLYGMFFSDSATGTAVGANGTIRRTTNSGTTWTSQSSGTSNILYEVCFFNTTTGLAVGGNGTIIRTTNGGTTWTSQASGTTQTLFGETFVNSNTGFAVGAGGTILRTTNGGITWTSQSSGSPAILFEVHFTDANTGTAVGSNGTILRTTTGGESGGPLFSVSPMTLNIGNVLVGSSKQDSVTVTNTGTSMLTISSVTPDNGEFSVTPGSGSLAPSASQKFYITFSPTNSGAESGNIIFVHDASTSPDSVTVSGAGVEAGFSVAPGSFNFGNVIAGSSKQDSVTVTNTGTSTLTITSVTSGNAEFSVTPGNGSLAPSASQKFYITFSPTNSGAESGNIVFVHNASGSPDIVTVSGTGVEAGFSVAPGSLNFGNVIAGSSKQDSVTVTNTGTSTLTISSVTSNNGEFNVTPPSGSLAPSTSQKFYITFSPTNGGAESGKIIFVHNASTSPDSVSVSGTGVEAGFSVAPGSLSFGNVIAGSSKQDSVTVTNAGTSTLTISSVTSNNGEFNVTPPSGSLAPSASQKFYITFSPTNSGAESGNIIFVHDASTSPDSVSVSGTGVEAGFSVAPGSLNFGNVIAASSKQDSVTVTNTGTSTLTISSVTLDNGEFSVTPGGGSLAPSTSKKFYITFSPTNRGAESGNIVFVHNASTSPDTVAVSGAGVEAGFSVAPGSLNFGNVLAGSSKQDSVTVTNTGTSMLTISSVTSSNGEFNVTPGGGSLAPSTSKKFYITFSPTNSGAESGNIIFVHDASTSPDSVAVSGTGVEAGFSIAPASLLFGNVAVGSSKQDSVTVTNTGASTLTIASVTSGNGRFSVTPGSGTLPPSTTKKFYISFHPLTRSPQSGNIVFVHNASGSPDTVVVSGAGITPPIVTTEPATSIFTTAATLNGTVDPNGFLTNARFEWGTTTSYGILTPVTVASGPTPLTFTLYGLSPGAQYHFRTIATNSDGTSLASDRTFNTPAVGPPAPPLLVSPANGAGEQPTMQTFVWNSSSTATSYRLQVSTSVTFFATVFDDSTMVDSTRLVGPLATTTTYYWRVRGKNGFGSGPYSETRSFTTGVLAAVATQPATNITVGSAVLHGTVDTHGMATSAQFEWGSSTGYGNLTPLTPVSVASGPTPILFNLGSLAPNTTYHYRARAENSTGTTLGQDVEFSTQVQVAVQLAAAWEMISNPVTTPNDSVRQLYPTADFEYAFALDGPYTQVYTLKNGPAYWEKFSASASNTITGIPRTSDTIDVPGGWIMIGSLSIPVDTIDIIGIPSGLKASHWIGYSGAYSTVSQIVPGKGYWVRAASAGQFVFSGGVALRAAKPQSSEPDPLAMLNTLTITDNRGGVQTLYFGLDANNDVPVALYDMPPMPPAGAYDVRFETRDGGSMVRTYAKGATDVRLPIRVQADAYPLTVTWHIKGTASYILTDGLGGGIFGPREMRTEGSVSIANAEISRFIVQLIGDGQAPKEFTLSQNYPNPFNPTTNIKYALPVDSRVTMDLYNVLGQRVRTLVNDNMQAGYHAAEWDGTGNGGQQLASGVYFLQMSAKGMNGKSFNELRKLMMLK